MWRSWLLAMVILSLGGLLSGQALAAGRTSAVHTCRGKGGVTTYTNLPCNQQRITFTSTAAGSSRTPPEAFYKHRENGVVVYSSRPPRGRSYETILVGSCYACGLGSAINWNTIALNTSDYATEVATAATDYGVDIALIRALIHAESGFNPMALSTKGAQGLMQLMPATAARYGVSNAFDAGQNIQAGVQHLAALMKHYAGDVQLVAAAYNAGEGAVAKYKGQVPPYAETQVYVQRVQTLRQRYLAALGSSLGSS